MKIYLVGGAIRDELLNLKVSEKDYVVVGSTEEEMLANNFIKVGKDFPVFLHPKTKEEYALARTERKVSKGYYGFLCDASSKVTLEEDLLRRDITINAMARDSSGKIIDPYNGQHDLENKIIRHISKAFVEDPIRVLRVARFKAKLHHLGFSIAKETMALMKEIINSGELETVAKERIWLEFTKALAQKSPSEFFTTLRQCNALKIIFPALDDLFGLSQNHARHKGMDAAEHTLAALSQSVKLTDEIDVHFAVLCHDLGKGVVGLNNNGRFLNHGLEGVKPIKDWCKEYNVPKTFRDLAICVAKYHVDLFSIKDNPDLILKILEGIDAFRKPERLEKFIIACLADLNGIAINMHSQEFSDQYEQGDLLRKAFNALKAIDTKNLQEQNLKGEKFAYALKDLRLKTIRQVIEN